METSTIIYLVPVGPPLPSPTFDALLLRLQAEEQAYILRQKMAGDRTNSLLGHLLVRTAACRLLDASNTMLAFSTQSGGKPYLRGFPQFQFSISHAKGTVGASIAGCPVGLDVEVPRKVSPAIVRRFFSPAEQKYVGDSPDRDRRLLEVWTKKEACAKWTGQGLAAFGALDTFAPEWASRLYTLAHEDIVLSLCCEDLPPKVCPVVQQTLVDDALGLAPYPAP